VEDELTPVEYGGAAWMLTHDLDALRSAPTPNGIRLLPPRDPYTQLRDRETIVEKKYHRDVWKTVGDPAPCWPTARSSAPGVPARTAGS
jgi:hypothetical protein